MTRSVLNVAECKADRQPVGGRIGSEPSLCGQRPENASAIRKLAEHTTEHVRVQLPEIYTRELVDVIFEQPYRRISNLVDKGIAKRQAASRFLHDLADLGVLHAMPFCKEKLFIHPKLMQLLSRDNNQFHTYARKRRR